MKQHKTTGKLIKAQSTTSLHSLDYIFSPRSIAIAGVSNKPGNLATSLLLKPLLNSGFKGSIYPLNNNGGECLGLKIYRKLSDIDGPVDFVIISIPAAFTPQLIDDCAEKEVKVVSLFTSGFSEIMGSAGKELEENLIRSARQGGIRILGPNCMGIFCPGTGLTFGNDFPQESGPVGFLSQSGGNSIFGIRGGHSQGVHFSKVISYGNAADLNECDFLEYFANDPETELITAYIEGVKDGKRFFRTLNQTAQTKPVIILKGGLSEAGSGTTLSHTGSLAGSGKIWAGMIQQTGAIQVHSLEEMLDLAMTFTYMSPPQGLNVGVIGFGGGVSVLAADDATAAGLSVPALPSEVRQELAEITPEAGNIFRNPVDSQWLKRDPHKYVPATVNTVAGWSGIDFIIMQIAFDIFPDSNDGKSMEIQEEYIDILPKVARNCTKPVCVVLHSAVTQKSQLVASKRKLELTSKGIPVFTSIGSAAKSIVKFTKYHQSLGNISS